MKAVVLLAALACFASFAWAMKKFFVKPDGSTQGMRSIYFGGTLFSLLHLGLILTSYTFHVVSTFGGLLLYAAALALFWWAVRTNRSRPLSFAFSNDRPQHLVVSGPYRYMRHPFYSAYTLAWLAGALAVPEPMLLATAATMFYLYWQAAGQEERKFTESEFCDAYREYQRRTWMFFPRLQA
jgi:protein-S-isoprenylcysteine O-methyltransferase Ste14